MRNKFSIKKTIIGISFITIILFSIFIVNSEDALSNPEVINNAPLSLNEESKIIESIESIKQIETQKENIEEGTILIEIDKIINKSNEIENNRIEENKSEENETISQKNLSLLGLHPEKIENNRTENNPEETSIILQNTEGDKGFEDPKSRYIPVENLSDSTQETKEEIPEEKIKLACFKNSEKEFEGKINKKIECSQIKKQDLINNNGNKEIIIQSNEHIEDPITIYTDIPEINKNQKEAVKIYWKNQKKDIEDIIFYDQNNDGLYDKVSWIVPHLSEQIFEIIINFDIIKNTSSEIEIFVTNPLNGARVQNPITFSMNINYTNLSNLNCLMSIDGESDSEAINLDVKNKTFIWDNNLQDGQHTWLLLCKDSSDPLNIKENSTAGNFIIDESYFAQIQNKVYLLGNNEEIKINITSKNNANITIELINPDGITSMLENNKQIPSPYILNRDLITKKGLYKINITFKNLEKPYSVIKEFSVAELELKTNKLEIKAGEEIEITLNISSPIEQILSATLYFGDDNEKNFNNLNSNTFTSTIKHVYNNKGVYILNLTAQIDGRWFTIKKNGIDVISSKDSEYPKIELLGPEDNAVIRDSSISFSYKASDNAKLDNCTFEIYNNSGSFGVLEYNRTDKNLENYETIEIPMHQFNEGEYSWIVECYDNSSNYDYKSRDFTVSFSNASPRAITLASSNESYEKKEEIEQAISDLEKFLIKKDTYDLDKIEILDNLGISEDLKYCQKRLAQIKIDLSNNLKYLDNGSLRETRKKEILEEFSEIKKRIPSDISIIEKNEFVKNSITTNLEEIIRSYLESKKINNRNIKELTNSNYEFQKDIKVLTKTARVEIKYPEETKEITLITKEISLNKSSNSVETILEIIPEDIITDPVFLTKNEVIKENKIYSFLPEDLENKSLVYYTEKLIDLKKIEQTETILFRDTQQKSSITGFFIYFEDIGNGHYLAALIIFSVIIICAISVYIKKIRIRKWKKDENVAKIFELKKQIKKSLRNKEIEAVKEKYNKIKELYPLISEECKKYLFKDLKKIRATINKKDISSLLKEYFQAKKQKRIEDSKIIYQKIRQEYNNLSKKDKEKIYNKIFKPKTDYKL